MTDDNRSPVFSTLPIFTPAALAEQTLAEQNSTVRK